MRLDLHSILKADFFIGAERNKSPDVEGFCCDVGEGVFRVSDGVDRFSAIRCPGSSRDESFLSLELFE